MIRFHLSDSTFYEDIRNGYVKVNYLWYSEKLETKVRSRSYRHLFSMGRFYIHHGYEKGLDYSTLRRCLLIW